ncbi:hypothetical protein J4405_04095 [Candidatus Woesearchaeota archaeon]|nr:hypothetical protein [Candidatus Woesearchaeota archaeon]
MNKSNNRRLRDQKRTNITDLAQGTLVEVTLATGSKLHFDSMTASALWYQLDDPSTKREPSDSKIIGFVYKPDNGSLVYLMSMTDVETQRIPDDARGHVSGVGVDQSAVFSYRKIR